MAEYTLLREIGKGGMGSVFEGTASTGKRVAIKMVSCKVSINPEFKELFNTEVASLKKMNHPAVVGIVGDPFSDEKGNLYLPMEFVEGETIEQKVKNAGPYSEWDAKDLLGKILEAFAYIHSMGCIHRDIKPSNIMVRPDGSVCVIDFGIAKDMKTRTGKTIGRIIGTDGYMSPEQASGNSVDYRTDIYSLGCLLHYMLTGHHAIPKKSNDYDTICSILKDEFPLAQTYNPHISDSIQQVILKAVDKNMLHRFQTAMEFKSVLYGVPTVNVQTKVVPDRVQVTVGRKGCDIIVNGEYISGCHVEIEYCEEISTGSRTKDRFLLFTDKSTNGTSVEGKYLHHSSMDIPFSFQGPTQLPEVFLAGREEYKLDWEEVIKRLREKWKGAQPDTCMAPESSTSFQPPSISSPKIGVVYAILSFICPIVGWVLWAQWKKETPERARKAAFWAWGGFALGLILNL